MDLRAGGRFLRNEWGYQLLLLLQDQPVADQLDSPERGPRGSFFIISLAWFNASFSERRFSLSLSMRHICQAFIVTIEFISSSLPARLGWPSMGETDSLSNTPRLSWKRSTNADVPLSSKQSVITNVLNNLLSLGFLFRYRSILSLMIQNAIWHFSKSKVREAMGSSCLIGTTFPSMLIRL